MNDKRPVVITTEWRGVFFGYMKDESEKPNRIILENARLCVYWSTQTRGVLGLAANGPNEDCRIGPRVPSAEIWKVTGIFDCTPEATEQWELGPWK